MTTMIPQSCFRSSSSDKATRRASLTILLDAIPLALQFLPNLAFLDIGLPGMDWLSAARHSASLKPVTEGCKFVAVTGYDDVTVSRGFDAHLLKPLDLAKVVSLVQQVAEPALTSVKPASA